MPTLSLQLTPGQPSLSLLPEPQLCYVLVSIGASGTDGRRTVSWGFVADASRSMRIPIVSEAQFRELLRQGAAQETLVDGVPVWQLTAPVPPEIRAAAPSALDFVARALHSTVERLDDHDRLALAACAEQAQLLVRSTAGSERSTIVRGLARLKSLALGEQTDLARGIALALNELHRARQQQPAGAAERLVLLTDGFTQRPEECLRLASAAAAEGIVISTIGLGGEFQEDVLTGMADRSAGRAIFLRRPDDIPHAIAAELAAARAVAARGVTLKVAPANGVSLRRANRIRPVLTPLAVLEHAGTSTILLGDIEGDTPATLLLEFMAPPRQAGPASLGYLTVTANDAPEMQSELRARYQTVPADTLPEVLDAAARANAARLQIRALETAARGDAGEAARLMRAASARLDALGEHGMAAIAREQAATLEGGSRPNPLAAKELTYATRRLGG
jgi:Ca-activated chloride channel family protein